MPVRSSHLKCPFPLPDKRYVGLLACQRDSLLVKLETEVIKCEKKLKEVIPAGKKGKKVVESADEWEIQFLDTVLFPEGGGQPSDSGTFQVINPDGSLEEEQINVREVLRRGLDAIHFCNKPVELGQKVVISLDESRRIDLMSQHTGQHVLSGVIDLLFEGKLDTLSWSLSPAPQPCYVELPRAPMPVEIALIQERCNAIIRENPNVSVELSLPGEGALTGSIPADYKGDAGEQGVVRVVNIEGFEPNPCCGTHWPSLGHLQAIYVLPHTTSIRSTNARLYFLVGPRVLQHLSSTHTVAREASLEIGCSTSDLAERVATLQVSARDGLRREKKLREEVAGFVAGSLLSTAESRSGPSLSAVLIRGDDATNSLDFLSLVASELKTQVDSRSSPTPSHIFILACCSATGTGPPSGSLLIVGSDELVAKAGKDVTLRLGGRVKGGGKGRWQGKLGAGRWETSDKEVFEKVLEEVVTTST